MYNLDFTGKVVMVTGANKGIGRGIAECFAKAGAKVAVCGRNEKDTQEVVEGIEISGGTAIAVKVDITSETEVQAAVDKITAAFGGRIDVLINNAGVVAKGLIEYTDPEKDWKRPLETELTGTYLCTRAVVPIMKKQRSGRIIVIGSTAGEKMAFLGGAAYTTAKAGQMGFARHMAMELAYYGITVNSVCPGSTATPMTVAITPPDVMAEKASKVPTGRLALPEDHAYLCMFLASEYASQITAQDIFVDGGQLIAWMDSKTYQSRLDPNFEG